ncbi:MAG TPA: multicopper oxidase domain-containing protein [Candidatus Angelobacter sp.]|nr:multicopper oxidase domain-containing protein [Candidatus Angelobacter sp.]
MIRRREFVKLGLAAGASGLLGSTLEAQDDDRLKGLCIPDGLPPDAPSPKATPFVGELYIPPVKQPVAKLDPPPDPLAHQRYEEFLPKKFYEIEESEFQWIYHPEPPYDKGSWSWGFDKATPGPTYYAKYGEPILVRRHNNLPPLGKRNVTFAMPMTTSHLHNGHTASESDGYPMDHIGSGQYWDHHYCCFPLGHDDKEKLTTLWYHDHMMDFTAPNVYAGLAGFFLLFDDEDAGDESKGLRLPSGPRDSQGRYKYDIPLILHDVRFDQNGQPVFNRLNTDGLLGDKYTINRRIQPFFKVERRKYRLRILNGGPSRFYQVFLATGEHRENKHAFIILTGDGNFLNEPVCADSIYLSVAQRVDAIVDFSQFKAGEHVYLQNRLEQLSGKGPTGRVLVEPGEDMMRFDVVEATGPDHSCIPAKLRETPAVDPTEVKQRRIWAFDYRGGLWTVNGKPATGLTTPDAEIEEGSAEVWTIRNEGKNWSHPIHSHFTEFLLMKVNGRPFKRTAIQTRNPEESMRGYQIEEPNETAAPKTTGQCFQCKRKPLPVFFGGSRRDITTLLPNDEIEIFMRWKDFHGRYVMHCHNVVHEDHSMMIRWDIVPPKEAKTQTESKPAKQGKNPPARRRPPKLNQ